MAKGISNSQFYMWRTLFAVAHADNIVTDEEVAFMAHILDGIDFSQEQAEILRNDMTQPQNVEQMFDGITDLEDRTKFFDFARDLVWVDGHFGAEEQGVMVKLFRDHFAKTDIDSLVGKVKLELEDGGAEFAALAQRNQMGKMSNVLSAFRHFFRRSF